MRFEREIRALFAAHFADLIAESKRGIHIERDSRAVFAKNVHTNEQRKCEAFDDKKRVMDNGAVELEREVNISAYFRSCTTDADNIGGSACKR